MRYVIEALVEPPQTDESNLRSWYGQHSDRYMSAPIWTIRQAFFDETTHSNAQELAQVWLKAPQRADGDPFVHGARLVGQTREGIIKKFGVLFYDGLQGYTQDQRGILHSKFGWHGVVVESYTASTLRPFETVRQQVQADWELVQRRAGEEAFWLDLESRYQVVMPSNEAP